jgi:hypothetical protein
MKEGDPQETSEQPANAPQAGEDTNGSNTPAPAPSASENSKPSDSTASPKKPHGASAGAGNKLRSSGIFKTANLSGVYNLNSLPSSSFSNLGNPPSSSANSNNNNTSNSNIGNINNTNGNTGDDHLRIRRQNGVATSEANDTTSSKPTPTISTNNNGTAVNTTSSSAPTGASSPLYTTLNTNSTNPSQPLRGSTNGTLSPSIDKDLLCPICLEVMNEAFISRCGHSFWCVHLQTPIKFIYLIPSLVVICAL